MGIIISGFSNIGKSHISKNKNISCFDLDTTYFKKLPDTNWEEVYVECARGLSEIYDYVFITTYMKPLEIMKWNCVVSNTSREQSCERPIRISRIMVLIIMW